MSVRVDEGWLMTPTGSSMGDLDPARLSVLDHEGRHISGDAPTKEAFLHMAMYAKRSRAAAIVHLHCTHSVAVSCLKCIDHKDVLPPLTAYYVMRIGKLPLVPYFAPGDIELAKAVGEMASNHHAVLLANHGPVVSAKSLADAVYATEELEETAKLFLALQAMETRPLTKEQEPLLSFNIGCCHISEPSCDMHDPKSRKSFACNIRPLPDRASHAGGITLHKRAAVKH